MLILDHLLTFSSRCCFSVFIYNVHNSFKDIFYKYRSVKVITVSKGYSNPLNTFLHVLAVNSCTDCNNYLNIYLAKSNYTNKLYSHISNNLLQFWNASNFCLKFFHLKDTAKYVKYCITDLRKTKLQRLTHFSTLDTQIKFKYTCVLEQ